MQIRDHRIVGAPFVPTKKQSGLIKPRAILMHYTAGWTTEGDVATLATSDRQVSAHLVLSRDGKWTQIVPFNRRAWHAGPSQYPLNSPKPVFDDLNNDSIGVEISNAGWIKKLSNGNFMDQYGQQITPAGQFLKQSRKTPKESPPPSKWPEGYHKNLGVKGQTFVWEPFTIEQLDALEEFVLAAKAAYPDIRYILGHDDVDERGWKTDPGPLFPMGRYRKVLETRRRIAGEDMPSPVVQPPPQRPPPPPTKPVVKRPEPEVIEFGSPKLPWYKRWNVFYR